MNPYSVSAIGIWPNEKYLYKIDPSIIDFRYGVLPMTVFSSPQLSEDNNFAVIDYNKPDFNSNLIGISSNAGYIYTDSDGFFKSFLTPNLTFSWTPSALRTGNYGNMLNAILLNTSDWKYFTVVSYPSELFLYPVEISKIDNVARYETDITSLSVYTISELLSTYSNIETMSSAGLTATELQTPLISSINYAISSLNSLETTLDIVWYNAVSSGEVTTNFKFISSVTTDFFGQSLSTFSYVTLENVICSYYINIDNFIVDYNTITTLENYVSSVTFLDKITAIDYKTFFEIATSRSYALQTSSILLKPYDFQFLSKNEYATTIKTKHSDYLSRIPEALPLNDNNLKTISYTLSGALVNCNKSLINFTETNNPIYGNFILEDEGANIRPETVKIAYKIHYANMNSTREPKEITSLGDLYDDMFLDSDRSIESSYIVSKNNNKLTFQLLQSALNLILPLEHPTNCVLSAILDLDKCTLEYVNQRFPTFNAIYNDFTPISGFPGTDLSVRYIADSPVDNQKKSLETTVLNISSNYGNFSLNSAVSCKSDNHVINWTLEYPPYYYSFKNTFVDKNNRTYSNVNSLGFYLSSEVFFNEIIKPNPNDFTEDYARIDLYTSVYSDFDIIQLPLSLYAIDDYIKYELVYRDQTLFLNNLSAFLVLQEDRSEVLSFSSTLIPNSNFVPYDIINSPYVPAVSGVFLRLIYNLDNGGAVFSVKPSLSTKIGAFDAFWGTTFSSGITYKPRNFVKNPPLDTIAKTITSATFSVESLTGIDIFGPDLRNTNVRWDYKSNGSNHLKLINRTKGDIGIFTEIVPNSSYLFNVANVVELTGLSNETVDVTFYSEEYNVSSTRIVLPELFDLYYENRVNINFEPITLKEKIKILKCDISVPFFGKNFNITGSERIKWNWIYDNITNPDLAPVTAFYLNNNNLVTYDIDTIGLATLSTLYFYIDTNYTIVEELNPLSAFVEVYSLGEVYSGKNVFDVNSYPDPTIFSTDFYVTYPNFPSYQLINTDSNIKSLTRPPNGTNIYNITPFELKTRNVSISGMNWKIKRTVLNSFSNTLSTNEEELSLTPNASGFYDDIILNRDYNLYNITSKKYYNNEIFTSNSPLVFSSLPITNITDLLNLSSYLILPDLITNNVFVTNITATENISPLATSINFITTSYYITSFDVVDSIDIVKNLNNLYTYSFYTSTNFININNQPVEYTIFNVNYWLSANYTIKTDKQTEIDAFSSLYINPNLNNFLSYNSVINPTTTVEYDVTKKEIEKNLYAIYDISLNAESVSIPNWTNLYDFSKSGQIIVATDTEFITLPKLILTPNFVWVPQWKSPNFSKLSNKFVTVLSGYNPNNIFQFLTGKTYGNRKDNFQEYNVIVQDVQEFKINKLQDSITIFLGAGSNNEFIQDQIIDRPEEYRFTDNGEKTILIENFRIPIKPEIYSTDGMVVYLTAYNKFFPTTGGLQYYGLNSLTATELTLFNYPITARTLNKDIAWDNEKPTEFEIDNFLFDAVYHNPKLFEYEKAKLLFYPNIININLDTERLIQVKQILEINPLESPNEIEVDKSTVTYELKSDYWSVSSVVPAVSNRYFDLFRLTVGDSTIPLTVSNFERSTLFLSATANIATKIPPMTFNRTASSQYTGPTDLWNTVYQKAIGNEETPSEQYKILFSEVNSLSTSTGTVSTYNTLAINDNLILTT
jgi:hypothetical protein